MGLIQRIEGMSSLMDADIGTKKHWFVQNDAIAKKVVFAKIVEELKKLFEYTPTGNGLPEDVAPEDVLFNFYVKKGYCDQYLEIDEGSHNAYHECVFYMHEKHGLQSRLFLGGGWIFHDHTDYIDVSPVRYILDKLGITQKKGDAQ